MFVNGQRASGGHHRPQRGGGQRGARWSAPGCQRIGCSRIGEIASFIDVPPTNRATSGADSPHRDTTTGAAVLRPQPFRARRRRVFTDLTGPAPAADARRPSTPGSPHANGFEARTAMLLAIAATAWPGGLWRLDWLDGRRMHSLIPQRWRTFTAVDFAWWAPSGLVRHRRQLLRRRLHPADGAGGRPRRLACRTTSAGSAAPRTRSAGSITCSP